MDDRAGEVLAVSIIFLCLAWISVLLRCWVRARIIRSFAVDDWLTLLALLLFTTYVAFVFTGVAAGAGRHMKDMTPYGRILSLKMWYFGELFYIISSAELRVTIGVVLLKFSVRKSQKVFIHILNSINIAFNMYYLVHAFLQCKPISFYWTRLQDPLTGKCIDPKIPVYNTYAQSALAIFIDWSFAILPVWLLKDLRVSKKKKTSVAMIMGLGALASTAPIIRFPYVVTLTHPVDFLWNTIDVVIWSTVEVGIGLTCISLSTLRPLLRILLVRIGLSTGGDSKHPYALSGHSQQQGYMWYAASDALPLTALSPAPETPGTPGTPVGGRSGWTTPGERYTGQDGRLKAHSGRWGTSLRSAASSERMVATSNPIFPLTPTSTLATECAKGGGEQVSFWNVE